MSALQKIFMVSPGSLLDHDNLQINLGQPFNVFGREIGTSTTLLSAEIIPKDGSGTVRPAKLLGTHVESSIGVASFVGLLLEPVLPVKTKKTYSLSISRPTLNLNRVFCSNPAAPTFGAGVR